jgi:dihydroneopterin aldolase
MDWITITGIRTWGHHGVLDHERELGQEFVVDVGVGVDLSAAGASDDLADTVDYGVLAGQVDAIVGGEPWQLVEALAARIADHVLGDERVREVTVTVHKPSAPLPVPADEVAVTITRSRATQD